MHIELTDTARADQRIQRTVSQSGLGGNVRNHLRVCENFGGMQGHTASLMVGDLRFRLLAGYVADKVLLVPFNVMAATNGGVTGPLDVANTGYFSKSWRLLRACKWGSVYNFRDVIKTTTTTRWLLCSSCVTSRALI